MLCDGEALLATRWPVRRQLRLRQHVQTVTCTSVRLVRYRREKQSLWEFPAINKARSSSTRRLPHRKTAMQHSLEPHN